MNNNQSDQTIVKEIIDYNSRMLDEFKEIYQEAQKNIEAVYGEHWTKQQKIKFSEQGRIPLNMPLLFPKIQSLLGFEKENREQFEVNPQGEEDELTCEIINMLLRHVEMSDVPKRYEFTKSDIYADANIGAYGACEIYIETDESKNNVARLRQIPYNEILFDLNFTDYEMNTCRRWQHHYHCYLDDLVKEFPEREEEFSKIEEDFNNQDVFPMREKIFDYYADDKEGSGRKIVKRIRDWKRVNASVYVLTDLTNNERYEAMTKAEAMEVRDEIIRNSLSDLGEITELSDLKGMSLSREDFEIEKTFKELIEYTEIAGNTLITPPQYLEVDECLITIYFSIFLNGKFFTPVSITRGLQEFMDRLFSQLDYSIGIDSKGGAEVNVELIAEEYNDVEEIKIAYVNGGLVFKNGQGNLINPIQRSGANSQYFVIFEMLFKILEDGYGSANAQGKSAGEAQSGRAISQLLQVAQIMTNNYLDNLRRFDLQVGRKLVKVMKKYYDYDFTIAVQGDAMSQKVMEAMESNQLYKQSLLKEGKGWLIYNKDNPNVKPIADTSLVMSVTKVNSRIDEKEITRATLIQLQQQGYAIPLEAVIETMPLKATMKQKIIDHNNQIQMKKEQLARTQAQIQGYNDMQKNIIDASKSMPGLVNAGMGLNNQEEV